MARVIIGVAVVILIAPTTTTSRTAAAPFDKYTGARKRKTVLVEIMTNEPDLYQGEEGEEDLHIEENRATNHKTTLVRYKSKMLPKDEHKR